MNKIKKLTALCLMMAMAVTLCGPGAIIAGTGDVSTSLDKGTGGGSDPIVKVKWEMKTGTQGEDDSEEEGAQFDAPMAWGEDMNYEVCAIATDPNGADDIVGVYADIYYPTDRPMHISDDPDEIDNPSGGCGAFIEENTLIELTKEEGIQLFCNDIRTDNENLPVFTSGYDYDEICGPTGELEKETAFVYCDGKTLTWEDPAGDYKVRVFAQDTAGNSSAVLENHYEYLPFTGYEVDFSEVDYGEVLLNVHKRISGDRDFNPSDSDRPTVRNIGNTRLNMKVAQDDMNLGQTSGEWNVEYDARVGNNESDWSIYDPFDYAGETPGSEDYETLMEILDLSEIEEMDFSILVTKWPEVTDFSGGMWLDADYAEFDCCSPCSS